jgi:hypothetical protein
MSDATTSRAKDYMLASGACGVIAFLALAGVLSGVAGGLGGIVVATLLAFPAACLVVLAVGRNKTRSILLSAIIMVGWIASIFASRAWATSEASSYEGVDDMAFLYVGGCATLVAIMAVSGIWFGYGLGLLRDERVATRSDGKHADV